MIQNNLTWYTPAVPRCFNRSWTKAMTRPKQLRLPLWPPLSVSCQPQQSHAHPKPLVGILEMIWIVMRNGLANNMSWTKQLWVEHELWIIPGSHPQLWISKESPVQVSTTLTQTVCQILVKDLQYHHRPQCDQLRLVLMEPKKSNQLFPKQSHSSSRMMKSLTYLTLWPQSLAWGSITSAQKPFAAGHAESSRLGQMDLERFRMRSSMIGSPRDPKKEFSKRFSSVVDMTQKHVPIEYV